MGTVLSSVKTTPEHVLSSEKSTPEGIPYFTYDDFKGLKKVGTCSTNSTVKKGYYKVGHDSRPVAVKEFLGFDKYSDREIQLLKGSSHPNIIEIFGVIWNGNYDSKTQKPIYSGYVMEYMELGSLDNRIYDFSKNYDNRLISKWIQQIGAGLQYLHKKEIIHRDIKPKNILLASVDHLKLAGFGLARVVSGRDSNTPAHWIGTDSYRAPEVLVSRNYGPAADVFSFGVTIWEIIYRKYPWKHVTTSKDSFKNDCVDLSMEENKIHVNASNFIRRCWQTNISDRPLIAEIIEFGSNFEQINIGKVKTILIMGGKDENGCTPRTMTVLSTDRSEWIKLQLELPSDVCSSGIVFLQNEVYIVGGQFNRKALYKLDKNLEWKRLDEMNVGRRLIANSCLELNGYIWIFGGLDGDGKRLKSVERYDPTEDKWTRMPDMSAARSEAAATVFWKDRIIVCGGSSEKGKMTSSAEWFRSETGEWNKFRSLPHIFVGHSLISFEKKLILMGGWNDNNEYLKSVWEMDPLLPKDGWKSLPPMKYSRDSFPGLVLDQEIYALGGLGDDKAVLDRVEIFDGKSWRDGPSLPFKRWGHSAVVIPQSLADRLCQYKP